MTAGGRDLQSEGFYTYIIRKWLVRRGGRNLKLKQSMKYIITESRMEQVVIKYLNKMYGDLKEYRTDEYPNKVLYIKGKKVYMERELENGELYVDYNTIWRDLKNTFSLEYDEIKFILTKWMGRTYNLNGFNVSNSINLPTLPSGMDL